VQGAAKLRFGADRRLQAMTVTDWWWLGLAAFGLVAVVLVVLLGLIVHTARRIEQNAAGVWTVGKEIAGNTVSLWMLEKTTNALSHMHERLKKLSRDIHAVDEQLGGRAGTKERP
jgi:hypothetical protein